MDSTNPLDHKQAVQDAMRIANSESGKKLLAALQNTDDPALRSAMAQAASGDYAQMQQAARQILASPELQKYLRELGE